MSGYPDLEGFAYDFSHGELHLGRNIYSAITNVSIDQPTTEAAVMGTRPFPLKRTYGNKSMGEGTVTFSDESDRFRFVDALGNAWEERIWLLNWTLKARANKTISLACFGCRVLSLPIAHEQGDEALGGDLQFSFLYFTVNGKVPLSGLPSPGR